MREFGIVPEKGREDTISVIFEIGGKVFGARRTKRMGVDFKEGEKIGVRIPKTEGSRGKLIAASERFRERGRGVGREEPVTRAVANNDVEGSGGACLIRAKLRVDGTKKGQVESEDRKMVGTQALLVLHGANQLGVRKNGAQARP